MTKFESFTKYLREKCPDRKIRVEDMGSCRFKVISGCATILMTMDEDTDPKFWARRFAEQIYSKQVTA